MKVGPQCQSHTESHHHDGCPQLPRLLRKKHHRLLALHLKTNVTRLRHTDRTNPTSPEPKAFVNQTPPDVQDSIHFGTWSIVSVGKAAPPSKPRSEHTLWPNSQVTAAALLGRATARNERGYKVRHAFSCEPQSIFAQSH